jgi:hypothetical protein
MPPPVCPGTIIELGLRTEARQASSFLNCRFVPTRKWFIHRISHIPKRRMAGVCVVAPLLLWSNNISVFHWFLGLSKVLKMGVRTGAPKFLHLGAFINQATS